MDAWVEMWVLEKIERPAGPIVRCRPACLPHNSLPASLSFLTMSSVPVTESHFQDKVILCDEAADFFGLPKETTRADLTKSFVKYIHANGLLDADGETINLDDKLKGLLDVSSHELVNILNLHSFLRSLNTVPGSRPTPIFQTPILLSDKLATFLGLAPGSSLARSEITKSIALYCKTHGLMDGQKINADDALKELLGLQPGDYLCILNLQRYLNNLNTA